MKRTTFKPKVDFEVRAKQVAKRGQKVFYSRTYTRKGDLNAKNDNAKSDLFAWLREYNVKCFYCNKTILTNAPDEWTWEIESDENILLNDALCKACYHRFKPWWRCW